MSNVIPHPMRVFAGSGDLSLCSVMPTPDATPEPRVLSASFHARLAALNHASRELRNLDYQIVWSRLAGPKPQIHIHRDLAVSVAPLLDRMGPRTFRPGEGCTIVSGEFEGVLLSWAEPK